MTSETAYVKLSWLLGNYTSKQAKEMISQNIAGEISDRQQYQTL
jgi:L-asparaginase/Glu-tRNA(Gln) amidotransferase subunit D